ncbi:DUF6291 domain-containing protein [Treponema lecithinolyticum]
MTDSFIFYASFAEAAGELDNEQYGALMRAINEYALFDKAPELTGVPKMLFTLIKPQLDANKKRRENGKYGSLGGRPQKEPSGKQEENSIIIEEKPNGLSNDMQNKNPMGFENDGLGLPKNNPNVNVNVNGNVNDIGAKAPEPCGSAPPKNSRFVKPTLAEVADYCRERGSNVSPERWYAHYESNGWKVGKSPMKDWRAAVRTWEHNDFNRPRTTSPPIEQADANYDFDKALEAMQDWG